MARTDLPSLGLNVALSILSSTGWSAIAGSQTPHALLSDSNILQKGFIGVLSARSMMERRRVQNSRALLFEPIGYDLRRGRHDARRFDYEIPGGLTSTLITWIGVDPTFCGVWGPSGGDHMASPISPVLRVRRESTMTAPVSSRRAKPPVASK